MSVYMTEEEQLELIKKWWQRYGNLISWCLLIVALCLGGYRLYNWHHNKITQLASSTYEKMMGEFSNKNTKIVQSYADELTKNYPKTVYADAARLTMAKIYITEDQLERAKNELQIVATSSKMSALRQLAKIRMARIFAANKSYDEALKELSSIDDTSYLPIINELKGDIFGAKGQYQNALSAYRMAMDEVKTRGMGNLFLEMKTNEVVVKSQSKLSFDNAQPA